MKANMNNLTVNDSVNSDITIGINNTPAAQPRCILNISLILFSAATVCSGFLLFLLWRCV